MNFESIIIYFFVNYTIHLISMPQCECNYRREVPKLCKMIKKWQFSFNFFIFLLFCKFLKNWKQNWKFLWFESGRLFNSIFEGSWNGFGSAKESEWPRLLLFVVEKSFFMLSFFFLFLLRRTFKVHLKTQQKKKIRDRKI